MILLVYFYCFDAAIDFQPLSPSLKQYQKSKNKPIINPPSIKNRVLNKLKRIIKTHQPEKIKHKFNLYNYAEYVDFDLMRQAPDYKLYPGVSPMWDNTSRRKQDAIIFTDSSPEQYEKWLDGKIKKFKPYSENENFIFINAWNESVNMIASCFLLDVLSHMGETPGYNL